MSGLEFECIKCGGPVGPDDRCPRCEQGASGRAPTAPPQPGTSPADAPRDFEDMPTMGVAPLGQGPATDQAPDAFEDMPTLGVAPVAAPQRPPSGRPPTTKIPRPEASKPRPEDIVVSPDQVILLAVATAVVIGIFCLIALG